MACVERLQPQSSQERITQAKGLDLGLGWGWVQKHSIIFDCFMVNFMEVFKTCCKPCPEAGTAQRSRAARHVQLVLLYVLADSEDGGPPRQGFPCDGQDHGDVAPWVSGLNSSTVR